MQAKLRPVLCARRLHASGARLSAAAAAPTKDRRPVELSSAEKLPGLLELDASRDAPRIKLHPGKANIFLAGNPMVFINAIQEEHGPPVSDEPVVVTDWKGKPIGWGMYNGHSLFRCRMLQLETEVREQPEMACNIAALVRWRVAQAVQLRAGLGLPCADTTAYRVINSEGDRLSGLVVDCFGRHAVVSSSASWVESQRAVITEALLEYVQHVTWHTDAGMLAADHAKGPGKKQAPSQAVGKSQDGHNRNDGDGSAAQLDAEPQQDSRLDAAGTASVTSPQPQAATRADGADQDGAAAGLVCVQENGVHFAVNTDMQKTGFYADQRESRAYLRQCVAGCRVLDLCCYTGGFAINAALHGAAEVVGVDTSKAAIALAEQNADLNGVASRCRFVAAKVEKYATELEDAGTPLFDVVILDPPKLMPNKRGWNKAAHKYVHLNTCAMRMLKPGGLLMTCSCSGAVAQADRRDAFVNMVRDAAGKLQRRITVLREAGAAADHPLVPEYTHGRYLTNVLVRVS